MTRDVSPELLGFQVEAAKVASAHDALGGLTRAQVYSVRVLHWALPTADMAPAVQWLMDGMVQALAGGDNTITLARAYFILHKALSTNS